MKRVLDGTGISVSAIGLGAMPLSLQNRPGEADAVKVIRAFIDGGGDFIDTANVYCLDDEDIGHNERLVAKALTQSDVKDRVLVATKGGLTRPRGGWEVDARPQWLRLSCEQSLRDLNVSCITLYQLHAVDPKVPLMDSLGELVRLQEEGKIRHIGLSNVSPGELELALKHARIVSVQNRCSVICKRDFHSGLVRLCAEKNVAYIPHSPVGGHFGHARLAAQPLLRRVAGQVGASPHSVALAWLLGKGDHILPIPGASKVTSIADSLTAVAVSLDAGTVATLDNLPDV